MGEIVTNRLVRSFCELMDYKFTDNKKNLLDQIASCKQEWKSVLDDFFIKFNKQLITDKGASIEGGMQPNFIW